MIVTNVEQGWEIIFQPAHGLLAGFLAENFAVNYQTKYWFETKVAITAHDDSKIAFQPGKRNYVTDAGAPKDFTLVSMSARERFIEFRDRLKNAYRKHRWIGLLKSTHADFLYSSQSVSKSLQQLLDQEQEHRKLLTRHLKMKKTDLSQAYEAMHWCDRCSLILCQNKLPAMQRRLEILTTSDGERSEIWKREDETIGIDPWRFTENEFEVSVEVHMLKQLAYENDEELEAALNDCQLQVRCWTFRAE